MKDSEKTQIADESTASIRSGAGEMPVTAAREINRESEMPIETGGRRSREDIFHNRPGKFLREKILALPEEPGIYMYLDKEGRPRGSKGGSALTSIVITIPARPICSCDP